MYINNLITGSLTLCSGGSSGNSKTRFTLEGGTVEEYDISGTLDHQWLSDFRYKIEISEDAYEWQKIITEIVIGIPVTSIGDFAFDYCNSLTNITIGNGVTNIGMGAFNGCGGLTNVTFGDNVTNIEASAFEGCYELTSIRIPDSVASIGSSAFSMCSLLTSVTFEGKDRATVQGMSNYPFGLDNANENGVTIHCTDGDITIQYAY